MKNLKAICAIISMLFATTQLAIAQVKQPNVTSPAMVKLIGNTYHLNNNSVAVSVLLQDGHLGLMQVRDANEHSSMDFESPFAILMKDGAIFDATNLRVKGEVVTRELQPNPAASRLADRTHGAAVDFPLVSTDGQLHATWSLILLDGTAYARQSLTINAIEKDLPIQQVKLIDLQLPNANVVGNVQGSPIVGGKSSNWFLGFEDPLSESKVRNDRVTAWIERDLPLHRGRQVTYSAVIGYAPLNQLRRSFLAYLENERAHPYRTFLHYNSWYDLGYFTPYGEKDALDRINKFGHELVEKRHVKLDSFLFDDGWDNHNSLWGFNKDFPEGFKNVKIATEKYAADPGVWMSPWGGYSKPKDERIAFGRASGYEIIANGYALSGPKYYAAFRDVALGMMKNYGINQFKFDGTGNVDSVFKGSQFDSDFAAAIHLIGELRTARPNLFVNLTTGTWPSPFWLLYADSIWRGGDDDAIAGVGPYRERWITYRDADTYQRVVQGGPLYPLNSLMLHGLIFAQHHRELSKDPTNDFRNEIRSYFGTGTQLQEMYITPSLLTDQNWDDLAEAANWSRANADVLKDTHWIGGNPAWLEVYGWASWSPRKGILVLRNPSDQPRNFQLRLRDALELPDDSTKHFTAHSPWKIDAANSSLQIDANETHTFNLQPFQVLTLDLTPTQ